MIWAVIAALCIGTVALKATGPLLLGEHEPSPRTLRVISLIAPAVLAGLVVYETLVGQGGGVTIDERVAGLAAAGGAIALRAPMIVVILAAAVATAGLRALS